VQAPAPGLAPLQSSWLTQGGSRVTEAGMQPEFRRMFGHMREFDLDQRRYGAEILAGVGAQAGSIIDRLFAAADTLAIHFQKRVLWAMRCIHVLAAATGIAFIAYSDLPAGVPVQYYAIYLFIALFAAGLAVAWLARRRDWHRKYIDYRALAEGLRVQRYWRRAGVTTRSPSAFAHDRFMQKTEVELGWIRNVMRVPSMEGIDDAPVEAAPLAAVISEWIGAPGRGGQLDYYLRKTEHRARMQRSTRLLGQVSLWAGFAVILLLAVAQRRIGSDTTGLLLAALAIVGIVAAARESYSYRKGDKELIQQYRYMRGVFADARAKLDAEPGDEGKRRILRALGEIALNEHSEWALMHRQRPLDNARL
jgi:hypothetical protein